MMEQLNGANDKLPFKQISSWDFSTLYTTIPHSDLKKCLTSLIYKTFEKNNFKKIVISFKGVYFSDDVKDGQSAFEYDQLVELLNFLIDNIYINFGDSIFRQTIGIQMGTNSAPLLANLYLFYYEYMFSEKLPKDNKFHGKYFKLT